MERRPPRPAPKKSSKDANLFGSPVRGPTRSPVAMTQLTDQGDLTVRGGATVQTTAPYTTTGTVTSYAIRRTREHISRFTQLYEQITSGTIHEPSLADMEQKDSIFQEIDYSVYR